MPVRERASSGRRTGDPVVGGVLEALVVRLDLGALVLANPGCTMMLRAGSSAARNRRSSSRATWRLASLDCL